MHRNRFPIAWMCQRLAVSRASFYRWPNPPEEPTPTAALRTKRKDLVDTVFIDAKGMAGAGQIGDLPRNDHDHAVANATVLSLMDELGIRAKRLVFSGAWALTCRFLPVGSSTTLCSRTLMEAAEKVGSVGVPPLSLLVRNEPKLFASGRRCGENYLQQSSAPSVRSIRARVPLMCKHLAQR